MKKQQEIFLYLKLIGFSVWYLKFSTTTKKLDKAKL